MHISAPIFSYLRGQEMRLWDQLAALDMAEALLIWIVATNGLDSDAACGLCRMFAKGCQLGRSISSSVKWCGLPILNSGAGLRRESAEC